MSVAARPTLGRDFRLSKDVRPTRYELRFDLDLERWSFEGRSRVALRIASPRRELILHAADLTIRAARARRGERALPATVAYDAEAELVILSFPDDLAAGEWSCELEFSGAIRDDLRGLYRSTRPGERYAATAFEPAEARRALPCFDEPEFKARFALTLVAPSGLVAIANLPVEATESLEGRRTLTRFAETPPISAYLLAFTVGPYEATPQAMAASGVPVRVWVPPGLADHAIFARDAHVAALGYLEDYTAIPYPYRKVDAIGIPDYAAGAMENPGAITYRLYALAADPATASTATLKWTFGTAAHEITHMWWGDLVTLAWWDDIWLNEAFASFVGNKAEAALRPEWRIWRDFVAEVSLAFELDALVSTHPISGAVANARQAWERFDAISYEKGAAVLRMIEGYLGEETFREGVRIYLRRHAESNATAADFWRALDEASGQDVTRIASAWISEPGYPLVEARVEPTPSGLRLRLAQRRFFSDPAARDAGQRWPIPLVLAYGTAGGVCQRRVLLDDGAASVELEGARWAFPNAGASGFYRFALDALGRERVLGHLGELSPEERLALVDDEWALARAGVGPTTAFVALLRSLGAEDDRVVLTRIYETLAWLDARAVRDAARPRFIRLVTEVFAPHLERLGWLPREGESDDDAQLRPIVLRALGELARAEAVLREARRRIDGHLGGSARLPPNSVGPAAVVASLGGDVALHERYVARMRAAETSDPNEQARFRIALAFFEDARAVGRTLDLCFDGTIRAQDLGLLLDALLGRRAARELAWRRIREVWEEKIVPLEASIRHRIIKGLAQVTGAPLAGEIDAFLEARRGPDTAEVIAQARERLRVDAAAAERIAGELADALLIGAR